MGWRSGLAALVGATLLTAGVVFALSTPDEAPPEPRPEADPEPSTLASYDTRGVSVVRGPFCDRVSPTGVEHALADVPTDSEEWTNGDRELLPDGTRDRVQEYGCRWTADDGTEASAWVFAPPVTRAFAGELAGDMPAMKCRAMPDAEPFGVPGANALCTLNTGDTLVEHAGLFGDAWLMCTLTATAGPADLPARASEWCVQVVEAARS